MSKKTAIEKANKRLLNEDVQPPVIFNDMEVFSMLYEIEQKQLQGEQIWDLYKNKLKEKGRNVEPVNVPKGAYM